VIVERLVDKTKFYYRSGFFVRPLVISIFTTSWWWNVLCFEADSCLRLRGPGWLGHDGTSRSWFIGGLTFVGLRGWTCFFCKSLVLITLEICLVGWFPTGAFFLLFVTCLYFCYISSYFRSYSIYSLNTFVVIKFYIIYILTLITYLSYFRLEKSKLSNFK
jgi:hypothetical protein